MFCGLKWLSSKWSPRKDSTEEIEEEDGKQDKYAYISHNQVRYWELLSKQLSVICHTPLVDGVAVATLIIQVSTVISNLLLVQYWI